MQELYPPIQNNPMFQDLAIIREMTDDMIAYQIHERMQMQIQKQQQNNTGVSQLNVISVGEKNSGSPVCSCLTILFLCLIFPIFFVCCNWWKKIVFPKYNLNAELYRAVGQFVRNNITCTIVRLIVCDSQFNSEKVHLLRDVLMGTQIQSLTVVNIAKAINYDDNEVDNFTNNVQPIKELPFKTAFVWDEQAA